MMTKRGEATTIFMWLICHIVCFFLAINIEIAKL